MPPPATPPTDLPRGRLARALIRLTDPERPRELAERRVGAAVELALALQVPTGRWGAPQTVLLALTQTTVYLLELRDLRPLSLTVGGVLQALPRDELVAHVKAQRVRGRVRVELSWPQRALFVYGRARPGHAVDELAGRLAADELERMTS